MYLCLVTGRNEVLAKVIFSQVCVILSTGGVSQHALQVSPRGGWVSQHALQVSPRGVGIPACLAGQSQGGSGPGGVGVSNFSGVGGLQFFRGGWGG